MKRIAIPVLASLVAVALAACSPTTAPGDDTAGGGDSKVLGIVAYIGNNAINQQAIRGATQVAEDAGWEVKVTDTQGNADTANAAMSSYATQGVGGIITLVFATTALGSGLAAAEAAGIPVASWGGGLAEGVTATTSNEAVGAASAKALVDAMGNEGDVLALTFHPGKLCLDQGDEFDAAVAKTDLEVTRNELVVPGQQTSAANFTTAWLGSHPVGGNYGIWTCWDEPMEGIQSALTQAGRTDVKTFSTNVSAPGILDIQAGVVTAGVWQPAEDEGAALMQSIIDYNAAPDGWEPLTIKIDGVVLDSTTVDDFIAERPESVK